MRAPSAAALTALSILLVALCWRGLLPGLWAVAPMTLAFIAACIAIIAATDEAAPVSRRRLAIAAAIIATIVLVVACGLLLHGLDTPLRAT